MAVYASSEALYQMMEALFARMQATHPGATDLLGRAGLVIRFRLHEPAATLLIDARRQPAAVHFGPNQQRADLDLALSGDTLHQILMGELSLTKAAGQKRLQFSGPVWKTAPLAELFRQLRILYPEVKRET